MTDENTNANETQSEDSTMPRATKTKKTAGERRQEKAAKAADKKAKAAKKAAKKGEKGGATKKVGVIHTILTMLCRQEGASALEIQKELAKKFPERDPEGMLTTVRIQITRLPKRFEFELKRSKDEKRGLVYKAPAAILKQYEKGAPKDNE